ncbi:MAG: GNAT family N-acetyltransferase [Alphaproteobacteria bacterium]
MTKPQYSQQNLAPIAQRSNDDENIIVRLAHTSEEIKQVQELRYKVFYEENGAHPTTEIKAQKRDLTPIDDITDHLIVTATNAKTGNEKIVGTYRILRQEVAEKHGRFYSSDEYDLTKLLNSKNRLLELGRSCVLADYRTKPILNLLWEGIASYITKHNIDLLFGCASFHGISVDSISEQLSYLHHYHSAPENIAPRALKERFVSMNSHPKDSLNERRIFASLPPLIKGYLRLGATIGDGAVIDEQFNTIDVCIVVQTSLMTERYRKYYERKIRKTIPGSNKNKT